MKSKDYAAYSDDLLTEISGGSEWCPGVRLIKLSKSTVVSLVVLPRIHYTVYRLPCLP